MCDFENKPMQEANAVPEPTVPPVVNSDLPPEAFIPEGATVTQIPVNEASDPNQVRDIQVGVGYFPEELLFVMTWSENGKPFFESRMNHQNFEGLTGSMVRILQQVNLSQAEEYRKRMEDEKAQKLAAEQECNPVADVGPELSSAPVADQPNQAESEQSSSN